MTESGTKWELPLDGEHVAVGVATLDGEHGLAFLNIKSMDNPPPSGAPLNNPPSPPSAFFWMPVTSKKSADVLIENLEKVKELLEEEADE